MSLRVMTYNIRGGKGMDDVRDLNRIAETVRGARMDIVCFQEVHQRFPGGDRADQPAELHRRLAGNVLFQRNINLVFGGYGIAIWSCAPFLKSAKHYLPSVGERRGVLVAEVTSSMGELAVLCTHWGLSDGERMKQAEATAQIIAALRCPVIVAGDLNETYDKQAVQTLLKASDLRDAASGSDTPTYPADNPQHRIDYLLYSSCFSAANVTVLDSLASDHRPLIAEFDVLK